MSRVLVHLLYHPRERLSKCSMRALYGRDDLVMSIWPDMDRIPLEALMLHVEGAPLAPADRGRPILLVDGTWNQARSLTQRLRFERRGLPGFRTAFPRASKSGRDPKEGLASAEALYVASLLLGEPDPTWLGGYIWRGEFLERNAERIAALV